jgi:hypothetical protein
VWGDRQIGGLSGIREELIGVSGVWGWVWHDFRRAVKTHLGDAGVEPWVTERILGHVWPGVEGIYNRARLEQQVRAALEMWAEMLMRPPPG